MEAGRNAGEYGCCSRISRFFREERRKNLFFLFSFFLRFSCESRIRQNKARSVTCGRGAEYKLDDVTYGKYEYGLSHGLIQVFYDDAMITLGHVIQRGSDGSRFDQIRCRNSTEEDSKTSQPTRFSNYKNPMRSYSRSLTIWFLTLLVVARLTTADRF